MFYFGRNFATDGSVERVARWNDLSQYEGFRRGQRMLTVVWGISFLAGAALRIAFTLPWAASAAHIVESVYRISYATPNVALATLTARVAETGRHAVGVAVEPAGQHHQVARVASGGFEPLGTAGRPTGRVAQEGPGSPADMGGQTRCPANWPAFTTEFSRQLADKPSSQVGCLA
ncbi:hypothetical protein [Amycolatopsis sp. SID8362]|uniref:hypothetical protein n=1 Tax=Amycolatopsis sp. SID8362 TaxID=2690346 RepID=UPI001370C5FE|nr:hypothetical protein [Amycolatopsis sp. SID8362]NBH03512.1 hypothetical protein [Amycolatopsis sp. SID8362]NED40212.1 hypothetical protein [Amycolatopsis sp. SID8362]